MRFARLALTRVCPSCLFVVVLAIGGLSKAEVTEYTIDQDPVYYGDRPTYKMVNNGQDPIRYIEWSYRLTGSSDPFKVLTTNAYAVSVTEGLIGSFTFRLYVAYDSKSGVTTGPHADTTIDHTVVVLPPDELRIVGGVGVNVALNASVDVVFQLYGGGRALSDNATVYMPQERFTDFESGVGAEGEKLTTTENVWAPTDQPNAYFYPRRSQVVDNKAMGWNPVWDATGNDEWVVSYRQEVRVQLPTEKSGNMKWYEFGVWEVEIIRVGVATWMVDM